MPFQTTQNDQKQLAPQQMMPIQQVNQIQQPEQKEQNDLDQSKQDHQKSNQTIQQQMMINNQLEMVDQNQNIYQMNQQMPTGQSNQVN